MKIKLNKIISDKFQVRDQLDQDHLESIMESFEKDGQWHPVIVRPTSDGYYDLIAGHYRFEAASRLGWEEIEATAKDVDDIEGRVLALKTNLMSKSMTEMEEGKTLKFLLEKEKITQKELAKLVGKSTGWVSQRLALVVEIHDTVKKALSEGKITFSLTPVIATLEIKDQPTFLKILLEKKISNETDARKIRDRLKIDTIFTIGFMGKRIIEFVNVLNDNGIKTVIDIRYNTMSQFKPDFNQDVLKRELARENIDYLHVQKFGVPPIMRDVVIAGYDSDCFCKWYRLYVTELHKDDFKKFVQELKDKDKSVLLCSETYARPKSSQKHYCHRDFLANLITEFSKKFKDETLHFSKRKDL